MIWILVIADPTHLGSDVCLLGWHLSCHELLLLVLVAVLHLLWVVLWLWVHGHSCHWHGNHHDLATESVIRSVLDSHHVLIIIIKLRVTIIGSVSLCHASLWPNIGSKAGRICLGTWVNLSPLSWCHVVAVWRYYIYFCDAWLLLWGRDSVVSSWDCQVLWVLKVCLEGSIQLDGRLVLTLNRMKCSIHLPLDLGLPSLLNWLQRSESKFLWGLCKWNLSFETETLNLIRVVNLVNFLSLLSV